MRCAAAAAVADDMVPLALLLQGHIVTYFAADAAGNSAIPVMREVDPATTAIHLFRRCFIRGFQ